MRKDIFLYGPPFSGKSSVGRKLAERLKMPFIDLDIEIERNRSQMIQEIFQTAGEARFRQIERQVLINLPDSGSLVALGGGTLINAENQKFVQKRGHVLFLDANITVLLERMALSQNTRPLLQNDAEKSFNNLLQQRATHYSNFQQRIDTTGLGIDDVVWQAQIRLGFFRVDQMGDYEVHVQPGGFDALASYLRHQTSAEKIALIRDKNVGFNYVQAILKNLKDAGFEVVSILLDAPEVRKTINTVENIWEQLLNHGVGRHGLVLALGGGVVNDLTGFAAATFLRGIDWIALPTTLLAMVDASLGGKTGINLPQGKNLAGAFYPPRLVLADTEVLKTLPDIEWSCGMAEIVKHGVIGDPVLFSMSAEANKNRLSNNQPLLLDLIKRAMAVKIKIIETDPYEHGYREALNFGHTLGHAIELASDYQIRHGEAVSIGMVIEAGLAEEIGIGETGISQKIAQILENLGLPTRIPKNLQVTKIKQAMELDKKKKNGKIRFTLPLCIGKVQPGIEIDDVWRKNAFGIGTAWS